MDYMTFSVVKIMLVQNCVFGISTYQLTGIYHLLVFINMRWHSWLRHCTTSWKVAGSIPDGVIIIFYCMAVWPWGQLSL
jgi:hypothetical protein